MTANTIGYEAMIAFRLIKILVKDENLSVQTDILMLRVSDQPSVQLEKLAILEALVIRNQSKEALREIMAAVRSPTVSLRLIAVHSLGECGACTQDSDLLSTIL